MIKQVNMAKPMAHIAINKSRLKQYNSKSDLPVYYLQKSSEFQIELFNPTTDTILAVISLNNKKISQGGLVLRPGERVFLDRYLDVPKKFKFETYEVDNTNEVKKAIEENGDFKVEFYREQQPLSYFPTTQIYNGSFGNYSWPNVYYYNIDNTVGIPNVQFSPTFSTDGLYGGSLSNTSTTTPFSRNLSMRKKEIICEDKLETGRVEMGSHSNQKMEDVSKSWEYIPFHTLEYKLLPLSQKVHTTNEINAKRYCTNCGAKLKQNDKFCGQCGKKA